MTLMVGIEATIQILISIITIYEIHFFMSCTGVSKGLKLGPCVEKRYITRLRAFGQLGQRYASGYGTAEGWQTSEWKCTHHSLLFRIYSLLFIFARSGLTR